MPAPDGVRPTCCHVNECASNHAACAKSLLTFARARKLIYHKLIYCRGCHSDDASQGSITKSHLRLGRESHCPRLTPLKSSAVSFNPFKMKSSNSSLPCFGKSGANEWPDSWNVLAFLCVLPQVNKVFVKDGEASMSARAFSASRKRGVWVTLRSVARPIGRRSLRGMSKMARACNRA